MAYLKLIMISCLLVGLFETSHGECIHQCSRSDTCTTEATWRDGRTSRFAQGSCFSPRFGGSCSGIPEPCESCRSACGNRNGRYTTSLFSGVGGLGDDHSDDCCVFPFKYNDITYNQCTNANHDQTWCATEVDAHGNYNGNWKDCDENCKTGGSRTITCRETNYGGKKIKNTYTVTRDGGSCQLITIHATSHTDGTAASSLNTEPISCSYQPRC